MERRSFLKLLGLSVPVAFTYRALSAGEKPPTFPDFVSARVFDETGQYLIRGTNVYQMTIPWDVSTASFVGIVGA